MREKIAMKYRFEPKQLGEKTVHLLYFYDDITARGSFNWETWSWDESETSAKYIRDRLAEIPAGEDIEVHINSRGGEVGEGVTIYNILRQKAQEGNRIVCYVDGYCYSVAVDIAMGADEIHMGLGTSMLVHFPWVACSGNAKGLRQMADHLDALGDAAVQLYMNRAKNITEEELRDLMEKETVLTPEKCLEYGFCDAVDTYQAEGPEDPEQDPADPQQLIEELRQQQRELRQQLAAREQFQEMLQSIREQRKVEPGNPPAGPAGPVVNMKSTFINALRGSY